MVASSSEECQHIWARDYDKLIKAGSTNERHDDASSVKNSGYIDFW
jgi:hypothetical protein